ncbi:helix-turn-helix domain-containing protein [Rhodopseudomonas sp.]|uniref:helix-turn-helix domain-containing protein n=1 Tax=Rhodopseudomonas sp. TaxID=1078 RepID=UPI0039E627FD
MSRTDNRDLDWTVGSDNVFADLGLPNPDEDLLKSTLVGKIADVIEARRLTQAKAGDIIGLAQPKVSELLNGAFGSYTIDRLYRYLTRLGVKVSITLENQPGWVQGSVEVLDDPEYESAHAPAPGM